MKHLLGSIRARVSLSVSVVLLVFVVLTAIALDRAFREAAIDAWHERLLGQLYLLMAAAELDPQGHIQMPPQLNEPRFGLPGSGLYANIADLNASAEWQSNSTVGHDIPFERALTPGEQRFSEMLDKQGKRFFVLGYGVRWQIDQRAVVLTFSVSEDEVEFRALTRRYQRSLWGWLGAMALLLLAVQFAVLRWGLTPLRRAARELSEVEAGRRERLGGGYPTELIGLARNLNELLVRERAQQQRYRDAMGDLAHSLKTPLAVLHNAVQEQGDELGKTVQEQLSRMDQIVQYQLQRAATAGASRLRPPLPLKPELDKIVHSLHKVYADKGIQIELKVTAAAQARIDKGDLFELAGNLIDNACKFGRSRVIVTVESNPRHFMLVVEDDGAGVADPDGLLARGRRADEQTPGQGLGLALVNDIATAYGGNLRFAQSEALGGARISLTLSMIGG